MSSYVYLTRIDENLRGETTRGRGMCWYTYVGDGEISSLDAPAISICNLDANPRRT